ncbi:hypothetical protein CR969_02310 [Candidatus Saccharibacteria bacterium]|nr:MAG: hypothetical protein CR969_02310 [Candidatus Saccharibacteria bacterium]
MRNKLLLIAIGIVSSFALAAILSTADSSAYTTAQIQRHLRQGVRTAYEWDRDCRNNLRRRPGYTMGSGNYRRLINGVVPGINQAAYHSEAWLSERGQGNTQTPTDVNYGQTRINLQLNYAMFLCGTLIDRDYTNTSSMTAGRIANQSYRWVTTSNARDRRPNRVGSRGMRPAQTASTIRVVGISVISGGGSVSGYSSGDMLRVRRNGNTRYWIAPPVNLRYNAPSGGITTDRTIRVRLRYKKIQSYHNTNLNRAVNICNRTRTGNPDRASSWRRCRTQTSTLTIRFKVKRRHNLAPQVSISGSSVGYGSSSISGINSTIRNTGDATSGRSFYDLFRFRVPESRIGAFRSAWNSQREQRFTHGTNFGCQNASRLYSGIEDCVENPVGVRNASGRTFSPGTTLIGNNRTDNNNPTRNAQVGDLICYATTVNRYASGRTARDWRTSRPNCLVVTPNYNLDPISSVGISEITEGAESIDGVDGTVINRGPTQSKPVDYVVSRFVVDASDSLSGGQGITRTQNDWPCYVPETLWGARHCKEISGSLQTGQTINYPGQADVVSNATDDITDINDLSFGDKVCYVTIVSAYSPSANNDTFKYSTPSCVLVAKRPKVQVWGGDTMVGGNSNIITKVTTINNHLYGSWSEYGVFSNGLVDSASGAGLSADSNGRALAPASDYNRLTFANTFGGGNFGTYGIMSFPVSVASYFSGGTEFNQAQIDIDSVSGDRVYRRDGDLRITGGEMRAGSSLVMVVNGTVRITGNVNYEDRQYSSVGDLPQLIVIAPNIIFDSGVERFDGWLVSDNSGISTCGTVDPSDWTSGLTAESCDRRLRVNGPVQTSHLYLRRTFGANAGHPGMPAEVINSRFDAALWGYAHSRQSGAIKTMHLKELPPRF